MFDCEQVLQWAFSTRRISTVHNTCGDLATHDLEEELARRLTVVGEHRLYDLVRPGGPITGPGRHRKSGHPLSWDLALGLLSSIATLRQEYQKLSSTAKGGRPKTLLPSEEKDLPRKYEALKSDLHLMLSWAERQDETITMNRLGEWMCKQSRLGKLRLLLFWHSLHSRLPAIGSDVRNRLRGRLGVAERAKELLCEEYVISPTAVDRTIASKTAA